MTASKPKTITDVHCRNAKPGDKLSVGRGLKLIVQENGTKRWELRYSLHGKDARYGPGQYPDVLLAQACKLRDAALEKIAQGVSPVAARRVARAETTGSTFAALFAEWVEKERGDWAPANLDKITRLTDANLLPYLKNRPIKDVKPPELLAILRRVESRGALDLARRCGMILNGVFRLAFASGRCESNPALGLNPLLKKPVGTHRAAITDPVQMAALIRDIDAYTGSPIVRAAMKLHALTFVRPGELRQAPWSSVDFDAGEWLIPVAIRKLKATQKRIAKPHWVPLSVQALAALRELRALTGGGTLMFPGKDGDTPISDGTERLALRRMGYAKDVMSVHGFRGMATSALMEQSFKREAIDRQLAHKDKDAVFAAYDRSEYRDERRRMMQAWADYLDSLARCESKVVAIRAAA